MARNLTDILQAAIVAEAAWRHDVAHALAATCAAQFAAEIDHDDGSGERWIRLLGEAEVLMLIDTKTPLAFAKQSLFESHQGADLGVDLVLVSSIEAPVFTVDPHVLAEFISGGGPLSIAIDPGRLSADDIWYASV